MTASSVSALLGVQIVTGQRCTCGQEVLTVGPGQGCHVGSLNCPHCVSGLVRPTQTI
jgi:hypothetical protein